MKRRRLLSVILAVILALSASTRVYALFGFGDVVFDPSNYAEAVKQLVQMEQQYEQLVRSYAMLRSQYEHLVWMARRVPVNMAARYRAIAIPWRVSSAADTHGTTGGWSTGINTGHDVLVGYLEATERLGAYGAALANLPAADRERVKTSYGTVELADGASVAALETIGRLRAASAAVEGAIQRLEDDSLSSDPEMNTEMAVLNKINAASLVAIRTAQDANKLLVGLAEQELIATKRTRDAEARAINQHIRFVKEGKALMTAQSSGASQAMRQWRMP